MTVTTTGPIVIRPTSLAEALAQLGDGAVPLAGGTWIMRSDLRGEPYANSYVSLGGLPGLSGSRPVESGRLLGATLTHTEIAGLHAHPSLDALREAAKRSAFPQVRNVATLGGNLANAAFPEADLVPALLALDATVEVATPTRATSVPVAQYVASRGDRPHGELITGVTVPMAEGRTSAFERITVRKSGEYALASVAVSVDVADGAVTAARIALGSVETAPRLDTAVAAALVGTTLADPATALEALAAGLNPREGKDAPGWYRAAVTPVLLQRVLSRLADSI